MVGRSGCSQKMEFQLGRLEGQAQSRFSTRPFAAIFGLPYVRVANSTAQNITPTCADFRHNLIYFISINGGESDCYGRNCTHINADNKNHAYQVLLYKKKGRNSFRKKKKERKRCSCGLAAIHKLVVEDRATCL